MNPFGSTEVRIEREARRSLQISVKNGWILIKAPTHCSNQEIAAFASKNQAWIEKQLQNRQRQKKESGEGALLLGKVWRFELPEAGASGPDFDLIALIARFPSPVTESEWGRFYKRAALALLPPLYKQTAKALGIEPPPFSIKSLARAWGVCHSSGRVELHWALVKLEEPLARYVICHELAHLTHMNHSQQFWALCDQYCPGARHFDRMLKDAPPP